jgi:hypothetical protein
LRSILDDYHGGDIVGVMWTAALRSLVLTMLVLAAFGGTAAADAYLVGRVTDLLGKPVANVRVHVLTPGDHQIVTTDDKGEYRVAVDSNKQVAVVVGAGNFHTFRGGTLKDGATQRLDFELEVSDGEIIRIIDDKPPAVPPKRPASAPRLVPPYSEEAIVRDAWAKAWLLLDIDATGKVTRVKLVKRPGFGLDDIAVREALKLTFEPAQDSDGKAVRSTIYWAMEWPSHDWLMAHGGTATRMPVESYAIDPFAGFGALSPLFEEKSLAHVPCAGSAPLNLDDPHPTYRDCSRPNTAKAHYLPWLDGSAPVPPDPPEVAIAPEAPLHRSRASYIPEIASTTVAAALLTGTIISLVKFQKYQDRAERFSTYPTITSDTERLRKEWLADRATRDKWSRRSLYFAVATVPAIAITFQLWTRHQRRSDFSVQPEPGGATAMVSGSF